MKKERIEFLKRDFIQGFPAFCGFEVDKLEDATFQSRLKIRSEHKQQDGFVHAGVIATLADHTAGYSAYTIVPENVRILTVEFKINYFKPAVGTELLCKSRVISEGKRIIVTESIIYDLHLNKEKMISKAIATMMAVPISDLNQ